MIVIETQPATRAVTFESSGVLGYHSPTSQVKWAYMSQSAIPRNTMAQHELPHAKIIKAGTVCVQCVYRYLSNKSKIAFVWWLPLQKLHTATRLVHCAASPDNAVRSNCCLPAFLSGNTAFQRNAGVREQERAQEPGSNSAHAQHF